MWKILNIFYSSFSWKKVNIMNWTSVLDRHNDAINDYRLLFERYTFVWVQNLFFLVSDPCFSPFKYCLVSASKTHTSLTQMYSFTISFIYPLQIRKWYPPNLSRFLVKYKSTGFDKQRYEDIFYETTQALVWKVRIFIQLLRRHFSPLSLGS